MNEGYSALAVEYTSFCKLSWLSDAESVIATDRLFTATWQLL
ncbi:hypothetical protein [Methylomonas paludis]|nr:hypothetical protein [Methylomonas paludis]